MGREVQALEIDLLGDSLPMLEMQRRLDKVARAERLTCLLGETGTGKELAARALHARSSRSHRPFITVHCGAIPDELFESELFGHVSGAYTGARSTRRGLAREAADGTLFLDEINSLSPRAQSKLLRFLESGEYRSVGSDQTSLSGAWVIVASNEDLASRARTGGFRSDLLYRLTVLTVELPALRERHGDVTRLAHHFKDCEGGRELHFSTEAIAALERHDWPGNVRELRNRVQGAVIMAEAGLITPKDLGFACDADAGADADVETSRVQGRPALLPNMQQKLWNLVESQGMTLAEATEHCEQILIRAALEAEEHNRSRAAARLGIHVRTLFKKMAK